MNENDISTSIDKLMDQTMSKITKAAASQNLAELELLTKRASEFETDEIANYCDPTQIDCLR